MTSSNKNLVTPLSISGLFSWHKFNTGITITGGVVSQWDDVTDKGSHLSQATGVYRPTQKPDKSISFNGVDQFLKTPTRIYDFISNPMTVYMVVRIDSSNTSTAGIMGAGGVEDSIILLTSNTTKIYARANGLFNGDGRVNNKFITLTVVIDEGSTSFSIDGDLTAGTSGTIEYQGWGLGCYDPQDTPSLYSEIDVKEVIVYEGAHTTAQRATIEAYLKHLTT